MPQPAPSSDPKAAKFQLENEIISMKREKETLEKEYFKLSKRGIKKKADLIRKTEVEAELKVVEKNLGQKKNQLRLMKLELKNK
jgi:hypothetical protein